MLKSIQEVEDYIQIITEEDEYYEEAHNKQYWEGIKNQLQEIAELTYQTENFVCCCTLEACPFQTLSVQCHPPPYLRRKSEPIGYSPRNQRKEISYGGFEMMFKSSNDSDFEMEADDEEIKGSPQFQRSRGVPLRRKKNTSITQLQRTYRSSSITNSLVLSSGPVELEAQSSVPEELETLSPRRVLTLPSMQRCPIK